MRTLADDHHAVEQHFRVDHIVQAERCETAHDLWQVLDPVDTRWTRPPARECEWFFRGQADSTWGLRPSAWRDVGPATDLMQRARDRCVARRGDVPRPWELQELAEQQVLEDFIAVAAREGLELPPGTPPDGGRPSRNLEVVTLAQHYGMPTGVLDFTRNPRVALFWAMHTDEPREDGDMAIWAVFGKGWGVGAKVHQHAKARNRNLLAQDGVTLEMTMADHFIRSVGRLPNLEECKAILDAGIVKLTLPRAEAPELRRLLEVCGVTLARLLPGYAAVARTALARLY